MKKMIHVTLMLLMAVMSFKADARFLPVPKKILKKEVIRKLFPLDRPFFIKSPGLIFILTLSRALNSPNLCVTFFISRAACIAS